MLFERGQRSVDFFLVLDGNIEIFDHGCNMVSRRSSRCTVSASSQASSTCSTTSKFWCPAGTGVNSRVVRVKRADFRKMLSAEPDIGEIIMRAFILRRVALIRHAQGGIALVGSSSRRRYTATAAFSDAQRLSASLAASRRDRDAEELLAQLQG